MLLFSVKKRGGGRLKCQRSKPLPWRLDRIKLHLSVFLNFGQVLLRVRKLPVIMPNFYKYRTDVFTAGDADINILRCPHEYCKDVL